MQDVLVSESSPMGMSSRGSPRRNAGVLRACSAATFCCASRTLSLLLLEAAACASRRPSVASLMSWSSARRCSCHASKNCAMPSMYHCTSSRTAAAATAAAALVAATSCACAVA